ADEGDLTSRYDVSTQGSSTRVKAGQEGKMVVSIRVKGDAHLSEEAPLRLALAGKDLTWKKASLGREDVKPTGSGEKGVTRFEAIFVPGAVKKATAEASLTFFLCTQNLCARQQKDLTLPIDVTDASR